MTKKRDTAPRAMMEHAIEVMLRSIPEHRADGKASPKVGAVLVMPNGTVDTACRGELRDGDHAEFTLLERKNRHRALDEAVLYATLEPCAPGARRHPKLSCAERIVLARIKQVYVGVTDPDPTVDRKGIRYLQDNGVEVIMFDRDLQDIILQKNEAFFDQALDRAKAEQAKEPKPIGLSPLEAPMSLVLHSDLSAEALADYRHALAPKEDLPDKVFHNLLVQQGVLAKKNGVLAPTGFGTLLFGKRPRIAMPQAGLLATIRYPNGGEETRDFDGPLVHIPKEAGEWLEARLPHTLDRGHMKAVPKEALPFELIREALVNALVHRDYAIAGAKCQLVVDVDTVVVKSPGAPVEPITLEQIRAFDAPMLSRNPVLHYVFNRFGWAEERGLGLRSLKRSAQQQGLPLPVYRWNNPYLELTMYRNAAGVLKDLPPDKTSELNKAERAGWEWMATQEEVRAGQYRDAMGVALSTAHNHLNRFAELGLAAKVGSGRSTRYRIKRA